MKEIFIRVLKYEYFVHKCKKNGYTLTNIINRDNNSYNIVNYRKLEYRLTRQISIICYYTYFLVTTKKFLLILKKNIHCIESSQRQFNSHLLGNYCLFLVLIFLLGLSNCIYRFILKINTYLILHNIQIIVLQVCIYSS